MPNPSRATTALVAIEGKTRRSVRVARARSAFRLEAEPLKDLDKRVSNALSAKEAAELIRFVEARTWHLQNLVRSGLLDAMGRNLEVPVRDFDPESLDAWLHLEAEKDPLFIAHLGLLDFKRRAPKVAKQSYSDLLAHLESDKPKSMIAASEKAIPVRQEVLQEFAGRVSSTPRIRGALAKTRSDRPALRHQGYLALDDIMKASESFVLLSAKRLGQRVSFGLEL